MKRIFIILLIFIFVISAFYIVIGIAEQQSLQKSEYTDSQKLFLNSLIAKFGEPPQKDSRYGSLQCVKEYLTEHARDPESLRYEKWSNIYYADNGWIVLCEFRAKNGFGGYNREIKWFIIKDGYVIDVKDSDAIHLTSKNGE